MKELIKETIAPYKRVLAHRITFIEEYESRELPYAGDRNKLGIALRNLLTNAIEAIKKEGEIRIHISPGKDSLQILISDTGVGISEDRLQKIFDLYYSTKDVGTGLGLPIAKKIITDHGGSISAESRVNKGTTIKILLPI